MTLRGRPGRRRAGGRGADRGRAGSHDTYVEPAAGGTRPSALRIRRLQPERRGLFGLGLCVMFSVVCGVPSARASPFALQGWETSLRGGTLKFTMKPKRKRACKGPFAGRGDMTRVRSKGEPKATWTTAWFAQREKVYLHPRGVYLVRVGEGGHLTLDDSHDGLLFYKNGKLLKRYSTKDLIEDPSKVRFRKALPKGCVSSYRFLSEAEGIKGHQFRALTVDGARLTFDIRTGKLTHRSSKK